MTEIETMQNIQLYDFLPEYPYSQDENFNQVIFSKKEFHDNILSRYPEVLSSSGQLLKHQITTSRYLSSRTPYDDLLIFHKPGTGKTCSAIGIIEQIRKENSSFIGAIILARGRSLLNNFMNELVFVCTDGEYIPDNYNSLTEIQKGKRIRDKVSTFYSFETFITFAKNIQKLTDKQIKEKYSNTVFVVDEAHNVRIQPNKKESQLVYTQFHRLFHLINNRKIVLMTGTPMKDSPEEVAPLFNLMLPLDQQLEIGDKFIEKYLSYQEDGTYKIKDSNKLRSIFKGKVSFLRESSPDISITYEGKKMGDLKYLTVYPIGMSSFQRDNYKKAYEKDGSESFYINSRQASLFIFPDGSWGSSGFKKYIEKRTFKAVLAADPTAPSVSLSRYALKPSLSDSLRGSSLNDTISKISKYSVSYASILKLVLNNPTENTFVYCEFVEGSGAILLSKLFELVGYSRARGSETTPGKRYSIITNKTSTPNEIKRILKLMNSEKNKNGEYIQVIIGSGVIGEGVTLKNILRVIIATPYWNLSETKQAEARAIRLFSHNDLINSGFNVDVKVYLMVSIPTGLPSIDLIMYETSEKKDISIKRMERILKESSFDCQINYNRNVISTDKDNSPECDYGPCVYTCAGITNIDPVIDISTYQLYYTNTSMLISEISQKYRYRFSYNFEELKAFFPEYSEFEILTALRSMIINLFIINNKYGLPSYLRENNDNYFLVSNIYEDSEEFLSYYCSSPLLSPVIEKGEITDEIYSSLILSNCFEKSKISLLPLEVQEMMIENAIIAKAKGLSSDMITWILSHYASYISETKDSYISTFLKKERYISKGEITSGDIIWKEREIKKIKQKKEVSAVDTSYEINPYGYYGIYDTVKNKFYIREVLSEEQRKSADKRRITMGKECISWQKSDLLKIALRIELNTPACPFPRKSVIPMIKQSDSTFTIEDLNNMTDKELCILYFLSNKPKKDICGLLREWFEKNNLVMVR